MKTIIPKNNYKSVGHYVPGIISNGMLYVSGQLPVDQDTGKIIEGDVAAHALMALNNVESVLIEAKLTRKHVVQCRVYIPDVAYWDVVNKVYAEFFGEHKPSRVMVPSRELHNGALVEIEAIAELEEV